MIIILWPLLIGMTVLVHLNYHDLRVKSLQIIAIRNPKFCPQTLEAYLNTSQADECLAPLSDYKSEKSNDGSREIFCFLLKKAGVSQIAMEVIKKQGKGIKCQST